MIRKPNRFSGIKCWSVERNGSSCWGRVYSSVFKDGHVVYTKYKYGISTNPTRSVCWKTSNSSRGPASASHNSKNWSRDI